MQSQSQQLNKLLILIGYRRVDCKKERMKEFIAGKMQDHTLMREIQKIRNALAERSGKNSVQKTDFYNIRLLKTQTH